MALHYCNKGGCFTLTNTGYCTDHSYMKGQAKRDYSRDRPSMRARGYPKNWPKIRKMKLARDPMCADPLGHHKRMNEIEVARHVHHKDNNPRNNLDTNLQSLCHHCHSVITGRETNE